MDNVLVEKVFNFICGSGGFVDLSVDLKHSSPLGSRKFRARSEEFAEGSKRSTFRCDE